MTYARPERREGCASNVARDPQINLLGDADQVIVGVYLEDALSALVTALKVYNLVAAKDVKARAA